MAFWRYAPFPLTSPGIHPLMATTHAAGELPPVQMSLGPLEWWGVHGLEGAGYAVRVQWWGEATPGRRIALQASHQLQANEQHVNQSAQCALPVQ